MDDRLKFAIRAKRDEDIPFIYKSWMNDAALVLAGNDRNGYYKRMRARLDLLLARAKVQVAVADDDDKQIFGFSCMEGPVAHYVYVKKAFRGQGIGKALVYNDYVINEPIFATHWSFAASLIAPGRALYYVGTDVPGGM